MAVGALRVLAGPQRRPLYRPLERHDENPILVIGTRFDPNTPYADARRTARRLGNAVLLTHDGYSHTSRNDPSACFKRATAAYLTRLLTPAAGTVFASDREPFDPHFGEPLPSSSIGGERAHRP